MSKKFYMSIKNNKGFWNFIIPAVAAIGSSIIQKEGAEDRNEAQIQAADERFDKQKEETDTAHQREVEDLKKAGLNPILSAKLGGSASATGFLPNLENEQAATC